MHSLNFGKARNFFVASLLAITAMFSTSCGDGDSSLEIPGVQGPDLVLLEDNLLISMVFENIELQGGLRYQIPEYDNSYIEISPDLASAGTLMSISVSLDDVFDGDVQTLPAQELPGGRALPGVAGGRLPAVAFSIPEWNNMAFYVGPKFFGVFVPTKLDIGVNSIITARYTSGGNRVGNISLVGEDVNGENSGFLLMLDMNATVKRRLERIADQF